MDHVTEVVPADDQRTASAGGVNRLYLVEPVLEHPQLFFAMVREEQHPSIGDEQVAILVVDLAVAEEDHLFLIRGDAPVGQHLGERRLTLLADDAEALEQ